MHASACCRARLRLADKRHACPTVNQSLTLWFSLVPGLMRQEILSLKLSPCDLNGTAAKQSRMRRSTELRLTMQLRYLAILSLLPLKTLTTLRMKIAF